MLMYVLTACDRQWVDYLLYIVQCVAMATVTLDCSCAAGMLLLHSPLVEYTGNCINYYYWHRATKSTDIIGTKAEQLIIVRVYT